jgi:glycosyltransferase involved in cell wall biosynthesis
LEHSSRILAEDGWQVLFLGTGALGADALRFPQHPNVRVRCLDFCRPGWRQKLHYFYFCVWVLGWTLRWHPSWIYASDPLVCPAALLLCSLPWLRVLYHEHDSPDGPPAGGFQRLVRWARRQVARRATCCVLPNEVRLERFKAETGRRQDVFCVWNCPSSPEVAPRRAPASGGFWLLYHGSIVPDRLPLAAVSALAALPDRVKLRVIGYETVGCTGYVEQLRERAKQLGIGDRLELVAAMPRFELMERCQQCDAGLAFVPLGTADVNHQAMTGASNKVFDYLALSSRTCRNGARCTSIPGTPCLAIRKMRRVSPVPYAGSLTIRHWPALWVSVAAGASWQGGITKLVFSLCASA